MSSVSRFGAIRTLDGRVVARATSMYRYGPLSGQFAVKLGAGLRIGGNILGGIGIAYTGYQMLYNDAPIGKGILDIGFGVIGFTGSFGLGMSAIYFGIDTFYPGGVEGFAIDHANQQNDFYNATGWTMRSLMH